VAHSLTRLSLKQLTLIAAIDDTKSLKRAAETIGMSQPRATKALQEAEGILGAKLFDRSNRGLTPTPEGDCAIRNSKTVLAQLSTMAHELQGLSSGAGTKLRIGTIMGAVPYVTKILRQQIQRYPNMSIEVHEDTSAELLRMLDQGGLDLVVGRHHISPTPTKYNAVSFHDEILKVVANPRHRLADRSQIELAELQGARWVVYTEGMPMRLSLEQEFKLAGLPFPANLSETRSALTTLSLIQNDQDTVALLSGDVADLFAGFGIVTTLPLILRSKSDPYEVITNPTVHLSKHAQLFVAELTAGASGS
jgi:DNA-binding transcriptional LysR family regulator